MYKVGKVMLEKALAGDVQAAKFLASYVIGRPTPAADPDRLDLEELRQYQEERAATRTLNDDLEGIAPGLACHLISTVRPIKTVDLASMIGQAVETGVVPGADQPSATDQRCQDRGPDPRTADANGANGGRWATQAPAAPSSIGDNGAAAPAAGPARSRDARPTIPDMPGVSESMGPPSPPYPNGGNGPSGPRRRRK